MGVMVFMNKIMRRTDSAGFTLVEVLVSVVLLSLVAILVLPMIARTTAWISDANNDTTLSYALPTFVQELQEYSDTIVPETDTREPVVLRTEDLATLPTVSSGDYDYEVTLRYDPYVTTYSVYMAHIRVFEAGADYKGEPEIESYAYVEGRGNLDE